MKQLEVDSEVHEWFRGRDRLIAAQRELQSAQCDLANVTNRVAKRLMPSDAKQGEIYIFPSTDGKAVRAFLKPRDYQTTDGAKAETRFEATIEEHDFNRK